MAMLFDINNKVVYPNAETLLISPFREIWERDSSQQKTTALEEFAYIEFTTSFLSSNPYAGYPENIKDEKVREAIITDEDWEPDDLIFQGQEMIRKFQIEASPMYQTWLASKRAAEKTNNFLNDFEYSEKNPKSGMPMYMPAAIISAVTKTRAVLKELAEMEKKVQEELYDAVRTRSGKKVSHFANPESIDAEF